MSVVYAREDGLDVEDYVAVLDDTSMRHRRPLANRTRIGRMIAGASFIVTAREEGAILGLGLGRCLTDFAWIAYCAELAVRESAQGRGIGAGIMAECRRLIGPGISLLLISEPDAIGFYEHIGMEPMPRAYVHPRTDSD